MTRSYSEKTSQVSIEIQPGAIHDIKHNDFWRHRPNLAAPGKSRFGGRGLFALRAIAAGSIIDMACTVEISEGQCLQLDEIHPIGDFYFAHPENPKAGLMAYGMMSFCNHAESANADIRWARHDSLGWMALLVALNSISEGEEITYRYKCPLWFSPAEQTAFDDCGL